MASNYGLACFFSVSHWPAGKLSSRLSTTASHFRRRVNCSSAGGGNTSSSPSPAPFIISPPPPLRSEVSLCVGTYLIPHPKKVDKGGEDAFFFSNYNGGVIGIADGVSGWAEQNVDPVLFSRELMSNASAFVEDDEVNYDPRVLIRKAHAATLSIGSATVVVAMLERNGILRIAAVGDCGLRVIRKGKTFQEISVCFFPDAAVTFCCIKCGGFSDFSGQVVFQTSPQEHYFDCPYQLSSQAVGQTHLDAVVTSVELVEGDKIVMGSDGLFDNVFDQEIVSTVAENNDVAEAAKALASLAKDHSTDSNFDSPYSVEARARGYDAPVWKKLVGGRLTGGKLDDITVVVGQVVGS